MDGFWHKFSSRGRTRADFLGKKIGPCMDDLNMKIRVVFLPVQRYRTIRPGLAGFATEILGRGFG